jgi:hypothetical protein
MEQHQHANNKHIEIVDRIRVCTYFSFADEVIMASGGGAMLLTKLAKACRSSRQRRQWYIVPPDMNIT